MAGELESRIMAQVQSMAEKDAAAFTELTMRVIRERVGAALGQDVNAKPQRALVKAAVEKVLESAVFQQPAEEDARRQSDANVFTQPASPGAGAPRAPSAKAAAVYRCVKKAVLREAAEMSSAKCGTLQPGETVVVVEISEVAGPDDSTVQRVRCEQGWTSVLSSSGNVLLEPVSAEAAAEPPSAEESPASADASPEGPSQTANADASPDGSGGTATAARKRKRLSLGLSDDEEEEEDDAPPPPPPEVEWVQCEEEGCGKWRRLPAHVKATDLPDRFVCHMNHWDATFASCEAPEEPEHNEQPAGEGAEDEDDEEEEEEDEGSRARRRSSARNKSFGRLTAAQQKAVARLKNRDTLSTIAALGDDDEDEDEEEQHSIDEVEHVESEFIQAKAAKKRTAPPTSEATAEAQDDEAMDELGPAQTISKKPRRAAAEKQLAAQSSIFYDDAMEERRLAARRKLPYAQRLLVEDDEARLRKALASEAKKGDPAGKIARGLARLQVHAAVADPGLLAAAKKCVVTAARREELAAEAARLEKKGQLREALQQYQLAAEGLDMLLKPGLAKHLKELEQKVFEMGNALRSYQPSDGVSADDGTGTSAVNVHKQQSDADLPEAVQRQLKDLKFEAIALKKAGDREGAKDKLRQMNDLRVKTHRAAAAAAADAAKSDQDNSGSGDIDWESAAGAIDFDSLYQQRKQEKEVVDEFGVDLATLERLEQEALSKVPVAAAPAAAPAPPKARMIF